MEYRTCTSFFLQPLFETLHTPNTYLVNYIPHAHETCEFPCKIYDTDDKIQNLPVSADFTKSPQK